MHLRRALLLFALVLGLAALVASLAPPPPERRSTPKRPQTRGQRPQAEPRARSGRDVRVDFTREKRGSRVVEVPAHVVVTVEVPRAGQVELQGLGEADTGEPGTPAEFDLFLSRPGRYQVVFLPIGQPSRRLGTLVARSGGS
jgi:hypothetical protein